MHFLRPDCNLNDVSRFVWRVNERVLISSGDGIKVIEKNSLAQVDAMAKMGDLILSIQTICALQCVLGLETDM